MSRNSSERTNDKSSNSHRKGVFKGGKQKKYQKVTGNKFEGQGYADKRKRKVVNQYRRDRKKLLLEGAAGEPLHAPALRLESSQSAAEPLHQKRQKKNQDRIEQRTEHNPHREQFERRQEKEQFQRRLERKHNNGPVSVTISEPQKSRFGQAEPQKSRFWEAEQEHKHTQAAHQKKREEYQENQEKQQAALKAYKEKKLARNKKLSKKTQRGQPVMKYQIDYLLDKLKNTQD